jgi:hypothetical protein
VIKTLRWRYVIGEILITTVGILIALALNAWWQNRQDRNVELEGLGEMRVALTGDVADMLEDLRRYRRAENHGRMLLEHIRNNRPYSTDLDSLFGSLLTYRWHLSNSAPYESLKSRGLGIIADDSLRLAVIDLYGLQNATIALWNTSDTKLVQEGMDPYFRAHFNTRIVRVGDRPTRFATPLVYSAIAKDPAFRGLLTQRIESAAITVPAYEEAIAKANRLIALIDRRISVID